MIPAPQTPDLFTYLQIMMHFHFKNRLLSIILPSVDRCLSASRLEKALTSDEVTYVSNHSGGS